MTETNMQGKVCLVTGSSSGIGKVTARELASRGATVVMACRNRVKGEAAQKEIEEITGNHQIDLMIADLSKLSDIRRAAEAFKRSYQVLDVLMNNAGGLYRPRQVTPDGLDAIFVTNYLAPFLLTGLLLERLEASASARIIHVSSGAHQWGRIDFEDLQSEKRSPNAAYAQAKLALILFTYELARRLKGTHVTVNCLHPGTIASHFGRDFAGVTRLFWKAITPLLASEEQGAQLQLYLATSPEVEGVTGKYFFHGKAHRSSRRSYDQAVGLHLWQVSEALTGQQVLPQHPAITGP